MNLVNPLNGSTILRKRPPWMQSYLPEGTESTCIVASPVPRRGQPNGGESYIVLESGLTCSLVAKLPQHSLIAVREFRAADGRCRGT